MTEDNNASVFPENSSFVLYFSVTEKIICNYSLPYKIFRFFNEKRFPHCAATHTAPFESEWKAVLDDVEYVNLLQFSSSGEPLFFCLCTRKCWTQARFCWLHTNKDNKGIRWLSPRQFLTLIICAWSCFISGNLKPDFYLLGINCNVYHHN